MSVCSQLLLPPLLHPTIIINREVIIKLNLSSAGERPAGARLILISSNVTAKGVLGCTRRSRVSGSSGGVVCRARGVCPAHGYTEVAWRPWRGGGVV